MSKIIFDENTVTIKETNEGNQATTSDTDNLYNGKGEDATVLFNPSSDPDIPTYNSKDGTVSNKKRPSYIGLGHELVHSYHYATGDYREGESDYYGKNGSLYHGDEEEIQTTGVGGHNKITDITENDLRKEHQLEERNNY